MSAVDVADVPRGNDTFGGLLKAGETPEQALRRLEKSRGYSRTIGTDDGQRLLAAATAQVEAQPNGGIPTVSIGGKRVPDRSVAAFYADARDAAVRDRQPADAARLEHIPLSTIDVGENIRVDAGELEELAASIRELGVLQPIRVVGPDVGGRYRAVWGQRRILASRLAGKDTIAALVEPTADVDAPGARRSIEQLAENLQRKDLNPIEEAVALRAVLDSDAQLTQVELGKRLGRSSPWIANTLRLLETAPEVQELVRTEKLTTAHAKAIAGLDVDLQAELAETAVRSKWTSADTERQVKWAKETATRTREEIARAAALSVDAIATLEKVAQRDTATIAAGGYGIGERIAKLLKADGWKVIQDTYTIDTIKNAGSCGCKGVWRINVPYGAGSVTVSPACNDPAHKKARDAEREAGWKRDREKQAEERRAQAAIERRATLRLGEILAGEPSAPLTLRLAIYALAVGEGDEVLADLLGIDDDEEVLDNVASEVDVTWSAIEALPDEQLAATFAKAIALALDDEWRVGQSVKDAIAALIAAHPEPAPATKPAKTRKAAPAAATQEEE